MLMEETARRKEFAIYPADYYRAAYDLLAAERRGELFLAVYQDTIQPGSWCLHWAARRIVCMQHRAMPIAS
jgi:hypothetical protein